MGGVLIFVDAIIHFLNPAFGKNLMWKSGLELKRCGYTGTQPKKDVNTSLLRIPVSKRGFFGHMERRKSHYYGQKIGCYSFPFFR